MKNLRTTLIAILSAVAFLLALITGATPASADDRQVGSGSLSVQVLDDSAQIPVALRAGSAGTVSLTYGVPGAWSFIKSDPTLGVDWNAANVVNYSMDINVYRVVVFDGSSLNVADRQSVCAGAIVDLRMPSPAPRSVDLSTIPWLAHELASGDVVFAGDYSPGTSGWNPNLAGTIWTPATAGERLDLVDKRLASLPAPNNANFQLQYNDWTYYTPAWDCATVPPFTPITDVASPAAVPDQGTVPVGVRSVRIDVLANDSLPNGATALQVLTQPTNGTASVDTKSADWYADYVPNVGFVGQDTFSYEVTDKFGKTTNASVVVDVLGEVVAPPIVDPTPTAEPVATLEPVAVPVPVAASTVSPIPVQAPFAPATGVETDEGSMLPWWVAVFACTLLIGGTTLVLRIKRVI